MSNILYKGPSQLVPLTSYARPLNTIPCHCWNAWRPACCGRNQQSTRSLWKLPKVLIDQDCFPNSFTVQATFVACPSLKELRNAKILSVSPLQWNRTILACSPMCAIMHMQNSRWKAQSRKVLAVSNTLKAHMRHIHLFNTYDGSKWQARGCEPSPRVN